MDGQTPAGAKHTPDGQWCSTALLAHHTHLCLAHSSPGYVQIQMILCALSHFLIFQHYPISGHSWSISCHPSVLFGRTLPRQIGASLMQQHTGKNALTVWCCQQRCHVALEKEALSHPESRGHKGGWAQSSGDTAWLQHVPWEGHATDKVLQSCSPKAAS